MWSVLGSTFPLAMGLTMSPVGITTALMLLLGNRGLIRALLFAVGWYAGMFLITIIPMLLAQTADEADPSATDDGIDILHLVFGVLFFVLAWITWKRRPSPQKEVEVAVPLPGSDSGEPEAPAKKGLMERLDSLGLWGCLAVGVVEAVAIIKNIPLGISAGAVLGQAELPIIESVIAVAIFALLATLAVLIPLIVALVGGEKVMHGLHEARHWIEANMTAITLMVLLVVGAIFLGQGLGLSA